MDPTSDLIDYFKLEAQTHPKYTLHVSYISNRAQGLRKVRVEKKWHRQRTLGHGSFGAVYLEGEEGVDSQRAVK